MDLVARRIGAGERDGFARSLLVPFLEHGAPDDGKQWTQQLELERSWIVQDSDRVVANCCIFTRRLTMPGPVVAAASAVHGGGPPTVALAALSGVGVHPTHRRRGLLNKMMHTMLDDARQRHEPLAGLLASESSIYGRFGFGAATFSADVKLRHGRAAFVEELAPLSLTLMDNTEAAIFVPPLFDRLAGGRAGQIDRNQVTWTFLLSDPVGRRRGATALHWAVSDDGYVAWRVRTDGATTTAEVMDLYGSTPEVEAALWRFVLDIDLVDEVRAHSRPVDESLRWRLRDPRQWQTVGLSDFLWVRILDVPAALAARHYDAEATLILDVTAPRSGGDGTDPAIGRFVLEASPDGAVGRPARPNEQADLRLGLSDLGSLLLGGVRPTVLAEAGTIVEEHPGALVVADRLFTTARAPYTGTSF